MKKKISAGIAAFSYIKNDDGSPRWPAEPVIRARYIKHLIKWLPKQNKNFVDLVTRNILLTKSGVIVSTLLQAASC